MSLVLHYTHRWLELSAGFVHAQISGSRHHKMVLVRDGFENRDTYPFRWVWSLASVRSRTRTKFDDASMILAAGIATRADLCHVHFAYAAPDVLRLVRRRQLPFVLSLHGHDASAWPRQHPDHFVELTDAVSAVVVPSAFLGRRAVELGFPEDRVRVIPSGIDTHFFSPGLASADWPEVLFVGRLVEKKGVDVLLAAWPSVEAAVPGARLRLIGQGPLLPLVLGNVRHTVTYEAPDPGRRPVQVRDAIRRAAVVVTPSRTAQDGDLESLLLVNLEAQACGRPVITTRHGGIPEFVREDETAVLVPENDPAALAEALVALLSDSPRAARLGRAGAVWARQFELGACTATVDSLYDELLGASARRGLKKADRLR